MRHRCRTGNTRRCGPLAVAAALLATGTGFAAADRVQPEAFVSADAAPPGGTFQVAVRLTLEPGWHVQSHRPSEETFIKTRLELAPADGLEPMPVRYPEGEALEAPALGGTLSVYSDGVVFGADVRVAADAAPGERILAGKVTYQACDDRVCLFPKTVDLEFAVRIDPSAVVGAPAHPPVFAALRDAGIEAASPVDPDGTAGPSSDISERIASGGFSLWLLGIFALGLGLNLTPCVYPIIAVTVSYFGRQGGGGGGRFLRATAYAGGIGATFTALFLVAGLSGQMFGGWLQNPWVLGALAAVLVLLALSNFGLFVIQAPAALRNRIAGGKAGLAGAALMGLAMGIVAAPCVGPLIAGLLLWVGQQADPVNAIVVGGTLSAGLALPYVALGMFSGSISSLPRGGDWMEWVKHAMGFILLGVALYFLTPFVPERWFLSAFAVLVLAAGIWLAFLDRTGRASHAMWFLRGVVITTAVVAAGLLFRLQGVEGIQWTSYSPEAVAEAATSGEPVLIEFTAAWCVPCRVMEHGAFKDAGVVRESEAFVRLQVDLTRRGEPLAQEAVDRYGIAGPPVIVFLGRDGREIMGLRVRESIGAGKLLARMREARGQRTASRP